MTLASFIQSDEPIYFISVQFPDLVHSMSDLFIVDTDVFIHTSSIMRECDQFTQMGAHVYNDADGVYDIKLFVSTLTFLQYIFTEYPDTFNQTFDLI